MIFTATTATTTSFSYTVSEVESVYTYVLKICGKMYGELCVYNI